VADYLGDRKKFNLDGVSFKSTQVYADDEDVGTGYNVVLFNMSSGVRYSSDSSRSFNVELYEYVDDDRYAFSPDIQLIVEEPKKSRSRYMGLFSSTNDTSDTLSMKTDGMVYHKITGVKFKTDKTAINQGSNIVKSTPHEPFDDMSDF